MSGEHALLSPSSAQRWLACPGSVRSHEDPGGNEYTKEGTVAHELAERMLFGCHVEEHPEYPGMLEHVKAYVEYVKGKGGFQEYEQKLDLSPWVPDSWGTADAIAEVGDTLYVIDLKYGKGVKVWAEENPQAMLYALGAIHERAGLSEYEKVVLCVFQPRLDHVSEWVTSPNYLLGWGEEVKERAIAALDPAAPLVPGEKQCRWCSAKPTCPAIYSETLALFDDETSILPEPEKLTDEQLAKALGYKDLITSWLKSVDSLVYSRLAAGESFPGFKLVRGRANRIWADEEKVEKTLSRLFGKRNAYTKKLLSPTQAEKEAKKLDEKKQKQIQKLIAKPQGSPTLAPISDKREAIQITTAKDFETLES